MKFLFAVFRRWRLILVTLITVLVPTAYAAGSGNLPGQGKSDQEIISPTRETIEKTITLSGNLDAGEKATLRFQSSGLLSWVGVKEGQVVKRGQALASLDRRSLEKSLKKELNDYLAQRDTFEDTQDQYEKTKDNKLVTDQIQRILNKAEYDLQNSVISYELQNLSLELATLKTPIEGVVTRVTQPYSGVNITPSLAEFDVVNPKTLYFSAQLDESDLKDIKVGQKATINLDAFEGQPMEGAITYISYSPITGTSGTNYQVKVSLPAQNLDKLRLYLNGDAEVLLEQRPDTLTLPIEAILSQNGDKAKVLVQKDDSEQEIEVVVGIASDERIEVVSGLSSDSKVILKKNVTKK